MAEQGILEPYGKMKVILSKAEYDELIKQIEALQAELAEFRAIEERECDRYHNIPSKVNLFSGREHCMRCNKSGTLWAKQKKEKP